jgi:hypothetical protein
LEITKDSSPSAWDSSNSISAGVSVPIVRERGRSQLLTEGYWQRYSAPMVCLSGIVHLNRVK